MTQASHDAMNFHLCNFVEARSDYLTWIWDMGDTWITLGFPVSETYHFVDYIGVYLHSYVTENC